MSDQINISFDSGGIRCAGILYRPTGSTGKLPCVVMAHGFSGTMDALEQYAQRFVAAGLAVLVFDYRYFGASEGEPRQLISVKRQREDWRAAIRFARACEGIDPERIALWGSSLSGGHVIAIAAADARIAAVVAQVPLIDAWRGGPDIRGFPPLVVLKVFAAAARDIINGLLGRPPYLLPVFGAPGEIAQFTDPRLKPFFDALRRSSPTWRNAFTPRMLFAAPRYRAGTVERLKMPLLVCVADRDVYASPSFATRVAQRAPRGEVKRYPIAHFEIYPQVNVAMFEQVVTDQTGFLRAHLLGAVPSPSTAQSALEKHRDERPSQVS